MKTAMKELAWITMTPSDRAVYSGEMRYQQNSEGQTEDRQRDKVATQIEASSNQPSDRGTQQGSFSKTPKDSPQQSLGSGTKSHPYSEMIGSRLRN